MVDICISTNTKSIFIEVKDSAKVENNQLTKYRAALEHEKIHNPRLTTKLILLTRASTNPDEERNADLIVFWPTLYFVVNRIITTKRLLPADTINTYILSSFENYLRENRMSIKKIKKTIVGSWDSVYHLLNMLDLASKEINLKPSSYFSDQDIGYRFQNGRYWLFLSWDNPKIIYFGVDPSMIFNKKKKARIEKLPIVNEVRSISRELDNQFFELSADLQLNKIAKLVGEMYAEIIL